MSYKTFELNGAIYRTDAETMETLRSVMPSAKATGDSSAVIAIVELGLRTGRVWRGPNAEQCKEIRDRWNELAAQYGTPVA